MDVSVLSDPEIALRRVTGAGVGKTVFLRRILPVYDFGLSFLFAIHGVPPENVCSLVFDFLFFLPCNGVLALLLMLYLIDAVMDGPELFCVGVQGRNLLL